jgi:predicted XRE-type DNA-binding protein
MKKFTEEDLILYLYKECSPAIKKNVEEALEEGDIELTERLNILKRTIRQLDKLKLESPSKLSLKTILQYADKSVRKR